MTVIYYADGTSANWTTKTASANGCPAPPPALAASSLNAWDNYFQTPSATNVSPPLRNICNAPAATEGREKARMKRLNLLLAVISAMSLSFVTSAQDRGWATSIAWSPDGETIAIGASSGIWLFDTDFNEVGYVPTPERLLANDHRLERCW